MASKEGARTEQPLPRHSSYSYIKSQEPASDDSVPTRQKLFPDKTLEHARLAGALPTHLKLKCAAQDCLLIEKCAAHHSNSG